MLVHNKGEYVRHSGGVRLIPGVNKISDEQWKLFIAHPLSNVLVEEGEIVPQAKGESGDPGGVQPRSLVDMNTGEVVTLIKDTHDLTLLAELEAEEKAGANRKGVADAIAKQVAEIDKSLEEARKKQEEGGSSDE